MAAVNRRLIILALILRRRLQRKKQKKRMWVRKIFEERKQKGEFHLLVTDLRLHDHEFFFRYFRMEPGLYEKLLHLVAPYITKSNSARECIGASERLAVTLRYLNTGDAQTTIAASFRISPTSIGRIIYETCNAIWRLLLENGYLRVPKYEYEWLKLSKEFERRWNFPHCIGAIDGKHVVIQAPPRSGSTFFNYKKTHSIVLLAACDANYKFTLVDIGDTGRNSDGGVFSNSKMGHAIGNKLLNIPKPRTLPSFTKTMPYVFVGDEAFQLTETLMKPYPREVLGMKERVFNYRLSRACRIIENSFGIAASRFRILHRPINAHVEGVIAITKAIVALHNFLMDGRDFDDGNSYCPNDFPDNDNSVGFCPGVWREEAGLVNGLRDVTNIGSHNFSREAKSIREDFRDYFFTKDGEVHWQYDYIARTH